MEDHIFGTYATDELKHLRERAAAAGVQHRARVVPLDPAPGQPFELIVTSGPEVAVDAVELWYTTDESEPGGGAHRRPFERTTRHWHTLAWGYVTEWRVRFDGLPEGTLLRYRIRAHLADGSWRWADWPDPQRVIELALIGADADMTTGVTAFSLSIDRHAPPAWAQTALVYHIFLDRFARGDGAAWPEPASLSELYGGTLRGVIEKLDYVAALGATCIWLSPLFPTDTHHGYDATDYTSVEPRLGTLEDLRELVDAAHARGIRVLLDFVANHVSHQHPYFLEALQEPESPYRAWFKIDEAHQPHGYRSFFNHHVMPELNTEYPAVQAYLIDAARYWVESCDVDGFRLDYAHGPSHAFWANFWRTLKGIKPDLWCIGEVVEIPPLQRRYLGYLDGLLDFQLEAALRRTVGYQTTDLMAWHAFASAHEDFFPPHERFSRPLFLDNHDTNRFLWIAGGDHDRLRLAALLLYTLPNTPILYYGTELGLSQKNSTTVLGLEASREPMPWERATPDNALLAYFQRLGQLRQSEPAMRSTERELLFLTPDQMGLDLRHGEHPLLLAINRAARPVTFSHERLTGRFGDLVSGEEMALEGEMTLAPMRGQLLKPLG